MAAFDDWIARMLQTVTSPDGLTITVYAKDVVIGGVTAERGSAWRWAMFCLDRAPLMRAGEFPPLGGVADTAGEALDALHGRWVSWLEATGLTRSAPTHSAPPRALDDITLNAPLGRREGLTLPRLRRVRRAERALRR